MIYQSGTNFSWHKNGSFQLIVAKWMPSCCHENMCRSGYKLRIVQLIFFLNFSLFNANPNESQSISKPPTFTSVLQQNSSEKFSIAHLMK